MIDHKELPKLYKYSPMPDGVKLGSSDIHGFGVFAKTELSEFRELGTSHLKLNIGLIRTPLGGFVNHSADNNCQFTVLYNCEDLVLYSLTTIRKIDDGEELTVNYYESPFFESCMSDQ